MKIVRDGVTYDTGLATLIADVGHEHWGSDGWAGLYQTPEGAFFKMVVDHDGSTILSLEVVDRNEARAFAERYANDRVEKFFGAMKPRPPRFSRRTVIAAIELMEPFKKSQLTRFLLKLGPELASKVGETGSVADRLNRLISVVVDELPPRHSILSGEILQEFLVKNAVGLLPGYGYDSQSPSADIYLPPPATEFLRALQADGFSVQDGVVCDPQAKAEPETLLDAGTILRQLGVVPDSATIAKALGISSSVEQPIRLMTPQPPAEIPAAPSMANPNKDLFTFKLNLHFISIDLNEAFRRIQRWRRSKDQGKKP